MTGGARPMRLERGYRRVLAWYPAGFRADSAEEVLAVLLATAAEGQRRVGAAECADLLRGAVKMHLGMSRSPRPVLHAVRLMCAGAVLTLAVPVTVLVTLGGLRSAIVAGFTAAQWHTILLTQIIPVLAAAPAGAAVWLWLAWANGRGRDWARPAFLAFFGLLTLGLLLGLGEGTLLYAPADLIAAAAPWLAALAATVLIFTHTASPYYHPHQPAPH